MSTAGDHPTLAVSAFGSPGMFFITVFYNDAAHSFIPWNGTLFCHVCTGKAKERFSSRNALNPENFLVPTISKGC